VGRLVLLFIAVPALELALLIEIGGRIGTGATLLLIAVTGAVGAALARSQGLRVLGEVQRRLSLGELPASSLVDGLLILLAGALLVTPGVLTDLVGFLCLTPWFRSLVKRELMRRFERAVADQRIQMTVSKGGFEPPFESRQEIDVTPRGDDSKD
jgi:UPF0716 protein FxsA